MSEKTADRPLAPLIVVTADTPEATRRWQVRLASTGRVRVHRPGDPGDAAIAVHMSSHDVWMSWAIPCNRTQVRKELRRRRQWSDAWLRRHADDERGCRIHRQARDAVTAACEAGWGIPGSPGDLTWLEFEQRSEPVDWRDMADIIPTVMAEKIRSQIAEELGVRPRRRDGTA
ncbi:hypothetical protein [Mycobacteroides abscessus]|uniref:hypothetical protein n=1 Tax=Mycobacteroides abscessus TaxID=36809 RepID=UPI00187814D5|nr:hypothetical protein [Mycobacteroides abscessus]